MFVLISLLIGTFIDFVIDTVLVGIAFAVILAKKQVEISTTLKVIILIIIFAVLDIYFWLFLEPLDITFTVGNGYLTNLLDLQPNIGLEELTSVGLFDFCVFVIQSFIAVWVGNKIVKEKTV